MRDVRFVRWTLSFGILGATLAFAAEVMVPEVTEIRDAPKALLSFVPASGEEPGAFLVRPSGSDEGVKLPLPSEGLDRFKLALIARTGKDGKIAGYSVVTWKPADKKPPGREWPELAQAPGEATRVRGAELLLVRQLAPEGAAKTWGFEVLSFRKIEPLEDEDTIVRAKKEVIEDGKARLVEVGRFQMETRAAPTESLRHGILIVPVWTEGKTLDAFDLSLVSTPNPEPARPGE
jgi:hypothetical protein